ncbi:hypothetical protein MATL_G00048440 [Megalops atlanticus]|uniref:Ig-like domain-containing protein n=1 Tax=Megalops atlanticus TaxID=7932 RepID=A0A9D3QB00_MEGAT|nr:hypothetical protein MATL_G00048440 [Megalops atlanticus]
MAEGVCSQINLPVPSRTLLSKGRQPPLTVQRDKADVEERSLCLDCLIFWSSMRMWRVKDMAGTHVQACVLMWILTITTCQKIPDTHVTCIFSKECVLPCRFKPAGEEVIEWYWKDVLIHSYLNGSDLLHQPHTHHKGRTSLFYDSIAHGNASLLLNTCDIQDRGRYKCHVRTTLGDHNSFIIAKVVAPIQALTLEMIRLNGYEELNCSSQNIYPAPQLLWFTDPAAPPDALKPTTRKTANKQGLYSVESTLRGLGNLSDITYICMLNSSYGTHPWTASLREREQRFKGEDGGGLNIPCRAPTNLLNFTLTWTFTSGNKSMVILTFDSVTRQISNHWENQTRLDLEQVLSGNATLWFWNLEKSAQTGTYTCAFSAFHTRHLVHTHVRFTAAHTGKKPSRLWIIAVIIAALVVFITAFILHINRKGNKSLESKTTVEDTEIQCMPTATGEGMTSTDSKSCDNKPDQTDTEKINSE